MCFTVHTAYSGDTVMRMIKTSSDYDRMAVPRLTAVGKYRHFIGGGVGGGGLSSPTSSLDTTTLVKGAQCCTTLTMLLQTVTSCTISVPPEVSYG